MRPEKLVQCLIAWFDRHARDLPWRRTADPYGIWISEIMLQQTRVKTVIPYWRRWMRQFPDILTLASASLDRVLKCWEGLGYYSRARNAHRTAQIVQAQYAGVLPADYDVLLRLPGIGRYTAGAICSIAFDQPKPVLDGNVTRVLTRLFGIRPSVRLQKTNRHLWEIAAKLVSAAGSCRRRTAESSRCYSALNQSLMELGAMICTPQTPDCGCCPVRYSCVAHRAGNTGRIPNLGRRQQTAPKYFVAFAIRHRNRWLVRQRNGQAVNAQLWEFPNIEVTSLSKPLNEIIQSCLGFDSAATERLGRIQHTITRYRIQMEVFGGVLAGTKAAPRNSGIWRSLADLDQLAFPSAHRKIVEALKKGIL